MDRILVLDNSIENDAYLPLAYWGPFLMPAYDVFRASRGELPADLNDYSHILLSGSTASVLENTGWIQAEMDLIRSAVEQGKVILGSCFGHQIIAAAMFGMDALNRRQAPEIGWTDIEILADDALFGRSGRKIEGFVFHYDEVCNLPKGQATVLARSDQCRNLGFKLRGKPVWGVQPHFEMGIGDGLKYLDIVRGDGIPDKRTLFNSAESFPRDSGWIIPMLKAFYNTRPLV